LSWPTAIAGASQDFWSAARIAAVVFSFSFSFSLGGRQKQKTKAAILAALQTSF
jgi:hypothetical protein